ncbi:MAG: hypothetical protein PHN98_01740 [Smithellaceae bacterium]|nr:hypothetical protein [Smithellaceae bacterium]
MEIDDGVYCSIAMDEAMNTMCQGSEPAFREVAISFFGFTENDLGRLFPIEDRYRDVLDDGLADGRCTEMAEVRIFVLALAWEKVKEDAMPPKAAIQSAWADARLMCEEFGVMI